MAQAAAVALGLVVLASAGGTGALDTIIHTRGTGGLVAESLSVTAAVVPATAVSVLLAARPPGRPGWSCVCRRAAAHHRPGAVQQDLVGAVDEALQPTQVAMWLAPRP